MFQLETINIRFEQLVICSMGCWGQKSPNVIQGHQGSLSVKYKCKNKINVLKCKIIK